MSNSSVHNKVYSSGSGNSNREVLRQECSSSLRRR